MENENKKGLNVPPLRFPEFKGEWRKLTLGEISEITMGQSPDSKSFNNVRIGVPFIQGAADLNKPESELRFTDEPTKFCYFQDILLSVRAPVGKLSISKFKSCIGRGIAAIKGEKILYFLLESKSRNLNDLSQGSTFSCISGQDLNDLDISLPDSKEELRKISHFLEVIDTRISLQRKTIEDLEKWYKALFLKIDKVEKASFKFSKIGSYQTANPLSWNDINDYSGKQKCIIYGQLFTDYKYTINKYIKSVTNREGWLSTGDELLFPSSTTVDAMSLICPCSLNVKGILLGGDMFVIHVDDKYFNKDYLSYLLNFEYKHEFARLAQGSTIIHLHYEDIKNVVLQIPSLEIQTKIANIINLIREKVKDEKLLLKSLIQFKSYLLQKMFI